MKKVLISVIIVVFVLSTALVQGAAAASSCDSCASKKVCSEAKAGGACGDSPASSLENVNFGKSETAKDGQVKAASAENGFAALSASVTATPKSAIIKVKGEKALLEKLSADFAARFGIKDKKSADCELVSIASELWIKISAGAEKEKIDYLESAGLKIEKTAKK
jgi:hypothetical protein